MTDEEKAALLDAAADVHGKAYIPGVGKRKISTVFADTVAYAFGVAPDGVTVGRYVYRSPKGGFVFSEELRKFGVMPYGRGFP